MLLCAVDAHVVGLHSTMIPAGAPPRSVTRLSLEDDLAQQEVMKSVWRDTLGPASWYDTGIRLNIEETPPAADLPPLEVEPSAKAPIDEVANGRMTASAEASLAAALISAIAVLGVDVASFGVLENFDAALLVGGLALSQVDSAGPVGTTLRTVGNVTSFAVMDVLVPTVTGIAAFTNDNQLMLRSRALLEMGIESAIYGLNPRRKLQEQLQVQYDEAVVVAEELRAERDDLPFWEPTRWSLDAGVRDAEAAVADLEAQLKQATEPSAKGESLRKPLRKPSKKR